MTFWKQYTEFRNRACDLKERGDLSAVPPIRKQIVELLVAHNAEPQMVVAAWNSLAGAHRAAGELDAAEQAARRSLSLYLEHFTERGEQLATYLALLAVILEEQSRFSESLPYLEEAVPIFETCRGDDSFVTQMRADLEELRQQIWRC